MNIYINIYIQGWREVVGFHPMGVSHTDVLNESSNAVLQFRRRIYRDSTGDGAATDIWLGDPA